MISFISMLSDPNISSPANIGMIRCGERESLGVKDVIKEKS